MLSYKGDGTISEEKPFDILPKDWRENIGYLSPSDKLYLGMNSKENPK